jgi:NADPH-dependent 2,4-dienoyl-CoA reductase/sulfur reductase-like enzyme
MRPEVFPLGVAHYAEINSDGPRTGSDTESGRRREGHDACAVVGAGLAGLSAIEHLLEQRRILMQIDLLEPLPTPCGVSSSL